MTYEPPVTDYDYIVENCTCAFCGCNCDDLDYLVKDTKKNHSYVTDKNHGKESRLSFKRLEYKNNVSLVEIYLETGRSHQIRVQFANIGHPLIGDAKYGDFVELSHC